MDWKKLGNKLLFPPLWLLLILIVCSTASLIYVFNNGYDTSPVSAVSYVLSAYTLTAVCCVCAKKLPQTVKNIKNKLTDNKHTKKYFTDPAEKTKFSLNVSLLLNILYVLFNAFSAICYRTNWFAIFAVYYFILAVMRFLLLHLIGKNTQKKNRLHELRRVRICAYILTTLNLALSGAVLMMVYHHRGFNYQGMLIYIMAAYTFYSTGSAIASVIKNRNYSNPVLSATKTIKLASALVSMLSLETAMFAQFGSEMPIKDQQILIMATGGAVSLIIVAMAIYMITRTTREIKNTTTEKQA